MKPAPARSTARPHRRRRVPVERHFSTAGVDPWTAVEWTRRDVEIRGTDGAVVFCQDRVEAPASWSSLAVRIVASKYFRGVPGTPSRESSVRELLERVVTTIAAWGEEDGYLDAEGVAVFTDELATLLLEQRASFNSPVWFNVGVEPRPQCSACFIVSVDDSMASILELARTEGMLFKHGSGSGCNLSRLRGSEEALSSGGTASGPLPFMRGLDALAGAIKSGGRTRRAAKMVVLEGEHPDVLAFVAAKVGEEEKARALIAAGFDGGFASPDGAYASLAFQNANHSVRLSDEFFQAVEAGGEWTLRRVVDDEPAARLPARQLLDHIAQATWSCGDPGVQYRSTIQRWHTCPVAGPIRASNPCAEFLFLDDSACNLASLNLLAFWDPQRGFDRVGFVRACEILVLAQEILIDRSSYPTPAITETSRAYRPLGLGYANLGSLLLAAGLPYDSEEARRLAASVTALLSAAAYRSSARLARCRGPFEGFASNRTAMLAVLERHAAAAAELAGEGCELTATARRLWAEAVELGTSHGLRHAQVTALAPTGTIAFMMDCDTTGVEPELSLVKRKRLVGGGELTLVNASVDGALERLGYPAATRRRLVEHIRDRGSLEGSDLAAEHLAVFDCALPAHPGGRTIAPLGHLRMLAALQPFVSGGISKTVNVPNHTSAEQIAELYLEAWRMGLKAVAIYRDGCKGSQPLVAGVVATPPAASTHSPPARRRLPAERPALTHTFNVGPHQGYVTVGLYEDGQPGEIFLTMAREGSTIAGLLDSLATTVSLALQYGVPLRGLIAKLIHTRYEPAGFTGNPSLPFARSVTDYVFRWLGVRFLSMEERTELGLAAVDSAVEGARSHGAQVDVSSLDAPPCHVCGALMVPSGSCHRCVECGASSGCG